MTRYDDQPQRKMYSTVLFDLDGTLVALRHQQILILRVFQAAYRLFGNTTSRVHFISAFRQAARRIRTHPPELTNYEAVTIALANELGIAESDVDVRLQRLIDMLPVLARHHFRPIPEAVATVKHARSLGYRLILATNPIWPRKGLAMRLGQGGLSITDFDYVTSAEVMHSTKPHVSYWEEILATQQLAGSQCLMIGNDPKKDLPAIQAGIDTFILARKGATLPNPPEAGSGSGAAWDVAGSGSVAGSAKAWGGDFRTLQTFLTRCAPRGAQQQTKNRGGPK